MVKRSRPNLQQLQESYERLRSVRLVAAEFGYTGEGIRTMMHRNGLPMLISNKDKYRCNHDFFSHDTEESFYITGFFAADGCVKFRKGKIEPSIVSISLSKRDADHLLHMKNIMGVEHQLHHKIVKNHLRNPTWKDSEEIEMSLTSRQMCRDLKRFNIVPRKTHIYTFPKWIINHPLVNHFMRGYFDGDGSFYVDNSVKTPQVFFNLRGTSKFLTVYR